MENALGKGKMVLADGCDHWGTVQPEFWCPLEEVIFGNDTERDRSKGGAVPCAGK